MAEPKLQIEKRMDILELALRELVRRTGRVEDAVEIDRILRGEITEENKDGD